MKLLVTGGAGFIGANFIDYIMATRPQAEVVNLDKMTYAGNLERLKAVEADARYRFVKGDICDAAVVKEAMAGCDVVVNFAAETHVDRSIVEPDAFLKTDIFGVQVLLEEARRQKVSRFIQISTDEVYGSIAEGEFKESDALNPSSPYSASKAGGELLARAYFVTYETPVIVTRAANNIGPFQYPEKVVPLFVTNALEDKELPLYGDGLQRRDYMHVYDHCTALDILLDKGEAGEIYNVGAGNELPNIEMTKFLLAEVGKPESLIRHVTDRPGHDRRYAVDAAKMRALGWKPKYDAHAALKDTIGWYVANRSWWEPIKSGEFKEYYKKMYEGR